MQRFEQDYIRLVQDVLTNGEHRQTRNSTVLSKFGTSLKVNLTDGFPILQGRKIYYKGVFGELAAMLRKPKHINDFVKWGCNFWALWAKDDGSIAVDYGNAWHAGDQITRLKTTLANNPTDRRMIISGWRPANVENLDLPCCHLLYQFYVTNDGKLHMQWYQRSADVMIGIPSDIVFAAAWLISIANQFGFTPGEITMIFGDTHIYSPHITAAYTYLNRSHYLPAVEYYVTIPVGKDFCEFEPSDIELINYQHLEPIAFELLA